MVLARWRRVFLSRAARSSSNRIKQGVIPNTYTRAFTYTVRLTVGLIILSRLQETMAGRRGRVAAAARTQIPRVRGQIRENPFAEDGRNYANVIPIRAGYGAPPFQLKYVYVRYLCTALKGGETRVSREAIGIPRRRLISRPCRRRGGGEEKNNGRKYIG